MDGTSTVLSGVFAGRYLIERELGHGGTAIVYLARDQQRGHPVAIKVLRPDLAESVGAERFLKEIRLNQRLHHPHILPLLDSGEHDRHLYFVLPHMEGGTLRDRLKRDKQLSLADTIAITRSIATALAYAHEKGLVHRDVKPENVLFTSGQACLGDFGIARALERAWTDESTTSSSIVRGTPPYMSPEQAGGDHSYDGRSDIYSLGCVVYEMLAGIQPFVGPTPESIIAQRLMHPPRPLRVYRPSVSSQVEAVIDRALQITPADRYQTATEFAEALDAASRAEDESLAVAQPRRSNWWRPSAVTAAMLVGAAAVTFGILAQQDSEPAGLPSGDPKRIAVLYFDDLSPESIPEYVVDGITEDLIDHLGSVRALHIISPNGVRRFKGRAVPLDSVRSALNVGTVVSGSVTRSENTVRVTVRLIDAASGQQLYSRQLDQPWMELFALKDKLADQVAFLLRQRLGEEIAVRERRATAKSYEAWEMAQRAGEAARRALAAGTIRNDPETPRLLLGADSMYARVERLDPNWPHPTIVRARLAMALALAAPVAPPSIDSTAYARLDELQRRQAWIARAIGLASEALRRESRSADALTVRGQAHQMLMVFGVPGSDTLGRVIERDLKAAVDLRPDFASAWATLAELALFEGRYTDAAAAAERAYETDAFFRATHVMSTAFAASLRAERFDDARKWCRMGLDRNPGDPRFTECELTLLGATGRSPTDISNGWRWVERIEREDSVGMLEQTWGYRRLMVAAILARSGMRDSARRVLTRVQATPPDQRGRTELFEAYVLLLLNDRENALARLAERLRATPENRTQVATLPYFRSLHGDPRFEALVRPRALRPSDNELRGRRP
jgi:serine/threonine-protein kinase